MLALTRAVSPTLAACELTHLAREPIDAGRAAAQHAAYERALESLGCRVVRLPPLPDQPDAVFVEDAAVVLDELAIVTRPGAASRRAETASVAEALRAHRPIARIEPPSTLDGGDVLRIDRTLYVGLSSRSDPAGHEGLAALVRPHGYRVVSVPLQGCLHLKSAVTQVAGDAVLLDLVCVDAAPFRHLRTIVTDPEEPLAANALRLPGGVLYAAAFPRTAERLARAGVRVLAVDVSELAKAEGGVTCCSILVPAR
jgi:dimethylargininase